MSRRPSLLGLLGPLLVTPLLLGCSADPEPEPDPAPDPSAPARPSEPLEPIPAPDGQVVVGEVQALFDNACSGCHSGPGASARLALDARHAYANLVDRASHQLPAMLLVAPGEPKLSYLLHKLEDTHIQVGGHGKRMPIGGTWGPGGDVTPDDLTALRAWIRNGAPAGLR